jgi:hypothetical protein
MRIFVLAAMLACGCRSHGGVFVGEVHVHGFAGGVHPMALFVATPVAADRVDGDSIVSYGSAREGRCVFTSSLDPPHTPPDAVDAGALRILGGRGIDRVELAFNPDNGYLPVGELPRRELFAGGEPLTFEADGGKAPAFRGTLVAPRPLEVVAPTAATLRLGADGLTVRWQPDRAERIGVALIASRRDGRWGVVRCWADDDAGAFSFPRDLIAKLPPRPRDLQLEITRNQIVRAASAVAGTGVLLHASFARKLDAHED